MKKEIILIFALLIVFLLIRFEIPGSLFLSFILVVILSLYYIIQGLFLFKLGANKSVLVNQFKESFKLDIATSVATGFVISSTIIFIEFIVLLQNGGLVGLKFSLWGLLILLLFVTYNAFLKKKNIYKRFFYRLVIVGCIGLVFQLSPYGVIVETFHPRLINELDQSNDKAIEQFNNGEKEEALLTLDGIISKFTPYLMAYNNKGYILHTMGRHDEALYYFNHVLDKVPNHISALTNRGFLYIDMNMYEEAVQDFTKVLLDDKGKIAIRFNRAISYYQLGQMDSACNDFKIATENNNNFDSNSYFDKLSKACK